MSAFFVEDETIHAALTLFSHAMPQTTDRLTAVGRDMLALNADAMDARYGTATGSGNAEIMAELTSYRKAAAAYAWRPITGQPVAALFKSLECWLYQCNEGDVHRRELFQLFEQLAKRLDHLRDDPAYKTAPWGFGPFDVAGAA